MLRKANRSVHNSSSQACGMGSVCLLHTKWECLLDHVHFERISPPPAQSLPTPPPSLKRLLSSWKNPPHPLYSVLGVSKLRRLLFTSVYAHGQRDLLVMHAQAKAKCPTAKVLFRVRIATGLRKQLGEQKTELQDVKMC